MARNQFTVLLMADEVIKLLDKMAEKDEDDEDEDEDEDE